VFHGLVRFNIVYLCMQWPIGLTMLLSVALSVAAALALPPIPNGKRMPAAMKPINSVILQ